MKITLRLTGLFGLSMFLSAFLLTYGVPQVVEDSAKGFVKQQLESEVKERLEQAADSGLGQKVKRLADRLGFQESQLKKDLEDDLPGKIASIMASMCGYDCEKKKQLASGIRDGYLEKIKSLQVAQVNLSELVKGQYVKIVTNLKQDLRIFTMSNAIMFAFLLLISLFKPQAVKQLYVPGGLLLLATLVASSIYLFGQDWFYTIIYNDYMGYGYLVYVLVIFGFLMDTVFNKCRITTEVFNAVANAVSSSVSAIPC